MYLVDLYLTVRLACHVEELSQREAARRFGLSRATVKKMLRHSVPPGYRRSEPPKRPKLDPFTDIIDRILEADRSVDPVGTQAPPTRLRFAHAKRYAKPRGSLLCTTRATRNNAFGIT